MGAEAEIENYLVQRVATRGGEIRKVTWIGRRNAPDRRVMLPSTHRYAEFGCWVELKAPGEKPTDAQEREHRRMRRLGELIFVIDSLEGVDELLEEGHV